MTLLRTLVVLAAGFLLVSFSRNAAAQPPAPELMARLAVHAAAIDRMRTHASYAFDGELDSLDSDGTVSSVKSVSARVVGDGERARFIVLKCTEDGKDVTEDARKQAKVGNEKTTEQRSKEHLEMPFLADAQPNYVFDQVAVDPADEARVQIAFTPKEASEHTSEGSVWVDTRSGTFLSAGFKLSKPGFFVDFVHVTLEFGEKTSAGPAISKVTVDGKGGLLFFRKHFRGEARMTDYRMVP